MLQLASRIDRCITPAKRREDIRISPGGNFQRFARNVFGQAKWKRKIYDRRTELQFQFLLRTDNLRMKIGTIVAPTIEMRARMAADLEPLFLKLPKLIPRERMEPAKSRIDVVLEFGPIR